MLRKELIEDVLKVLLFNYLEFKIWGIEKYFIKFEYNQGNY